MKEISLGNNEQTWTVVGVLALVAMIGIFVYDSVVPRPSVLRERAKQGAQERDLIRATAEKRDQFQNAKQVVARTSWSGSAERVTPAILERLTKIASTKGLQIQSFRPQKVTQAADLDVLAFNVALEGPFLQVMGFIQLLEKQEKNLTITLVQLASADGESDVVNITIGVSAFVVEQEEVPANGKN